MMTHSNYTMYKNAGLIFLLGFAAGLPLLLIFSSLSLWLNEAGVSKSAVTMFSWAALGYSFKFVWAPLIDQLPVPILRRLLGRRRSWLLLAQLLVIGAILMMASIDPSAGTDPNSGSRALALMAWAAVMLGFASATQDICIDAFRIECAPPEWQGILSSLYVAGYRIGLIVAGAGALYLAAYYGSSIDNYHYQAWSDAYRLMAGAMGIGVLATLLASEPANTDTSQHTRTRSDNLKLMGVFLISIIAFMLCYRFIGSAIASVQASLSIGGHIVAVLSTALRLTLSLIMALALGFYGARYIFNAERTGYDLWMTPVRDLFQRYGIGAAWLLLCLIGLYRISDIVLGVTSNLFYQDLGFTKEEIATAVKTYGVAISIAGGFLGGIFITRIGVMSVLFWGAVLSALTNLLFVMLAQVGAEVNVMYLVVSADNLAAGFATAGFIAFLSSLTNTSFTAVQFAIFTSIMTLFPKALGGYAGSIVEGVGYSWFFTITALLGVPVIYLTILAARRLPATALASE